MTNAPSSDENEIVSQALKISHCSSSVEISSANLTCLTLLAVSFLLTFTYTLAHSVSITEFSVSVSDNSGG